MADVLSSELVQQRVESAIENARVKVSTDGYYYNIEVVSDAFAGKRAVARQQMVYRALSDLIAEGSMHAVNIKALAPDEV